VVIAPVKGHLPFVLIKRPQIDFEGIHIQMSMIDTGSSSVKQSA
jgi:hypothetical protein